MPVRKVTAEEILGRKPLVLSARPFHKGLKKVSNKSDERSSKPPAKT